MWWATKTTSTSCTRAVPPPTWSTYAFLPGSRLQVPSLWQWWQQLRKQQRQVIRFGTRQPHLSEHRLLWVIRRLRPRRAASEPQTSQDSFLLRQNGWRRRIETPCKFVPNGRWWIYVLDLVTSQILQLRNWLQQNFIYFSWNLHASVLYICNTILQC